MITNCQQIKWEYCGNDFDEIDKISSLPFPKMMLETFFNNIILNEDELVMKNDTERFGGVYDVKNNQTLFFDKNTIHNMEEIYKSLKDGICKFSYYNIGNVIVGGIVACNKEYAYKTMKMMDSIQKPFEPKYYMVEIMNDTDNYYFNMDNKGRIVYENFDKNYKLSESNIRKMFDNSIRNQINEVLKLAGVK